MFEVVSDLVLNEYAVTQENAHGIFQIFLEFYFNAGYFVVILNTECKRHINLALIASCHVSIANNTPHDMQAWTPTQFWPGIVSNFTIFNQDLC